METHLKGEETLKSRVISPTPSSLCPTESTAVGCAELHDLEEEGEQRPTSRCTGEVRSWTQVSERLRGLFQELAEEDLEDTHEAPASPFGSVLACGTQTDAPRSVEADLSEVENVSWRDWQAVGSRLAKVLRRMSPEDSEEEDEAEPEPI
ncbi:unnamed protein product [Durusdinium trenchii]|uniref:Uncharacterized protein n=1 Tax=Durusdinium trenchii TaxID=1381693 RepID=A0ABP0I474_9DINO